MPDEKKPKKKGDLRPDVKLKVTPLERGEAYELMKRFRLREKGESIPQDPSILVHSHIEKERKEYGLRKWGAGLLRRIRRRG